MPKDFGIDEHRILKLFEIGQTFIFNGNKYTILKSGKPVCSNGEPKTDIYVLAKSNKDTIELKISFKKSNADFLENKISAERAEQLFGPNWSDIIKHSILQLKEAFQSRPLVYLQDTGHTEAGSITLGWKFELLNVKSGILSNKMVLSKSQVLDVYAGTNLPNDKKNSSVNGEIIKNCGIANYILFENAPINNIQSAIDQLVTIKEYTEKHPDIYFACKALNYRTYKLKFDGNRPLSVSVNWFINDENKLDCKLMFNSPLKFGGNISAIKLAESLSKLNITNTNELSSNNISNKVLISGNLPS